MIINVIDMVDGSGQYVKQYLVQCKNSNFIELYGMSNGLHEMKNRIISTASPFSIKALRIFGHGGPGWQNVAAGTSDSSRCSHDSAITASALQNLAVLGPYFDTNARVELRGCSVAGDRGRMISALAQLWKVRVQAATCDQKGLLEWYSVVEARPGFSGLFPITPVPLEPRELNR
jgi:hypothetical protein